MRAFRMRSPSPATVVAVVALISANAGLGGCGGGSEEDASGGNKTYGSGEDAASFVSSANRYCPDFAELARLGDKSQDSSDVPGAARATAKYAQKGEQLADNLSQLRPPGGTEKAWSRFVRAIRAIAGTEGELIQAFQNRDSQRARELEAELRQNQAEFIAAARALDDAGIKPDCLGD